MEWLAYLATVLGLTLPLAVGFIVIGVIIVALAIIGGETYRENDTDKRVTDDRLAHPRSRSRSRRITQN